MTQNSIEPESLNRKDLYSFLEEKQNQYNSPAFIKEDPIQIPHRFSKKEDIEIAGFLAATIAWGQRKTIIRNASKLMELMDDAPHDFVIHHEESDLIRFNSFVHRTFNAEDCRYFITSMKYIYQEYDGLEKVLMVRESEEDSSHSISRFKEIFFSLDHPSRTRKHVSDPLSGSAAKRINMYLRWMVRKDKKGVDFGIWRSFPMSKLSIPLDVHTGNVARSLGLLKRKKNDLKAVQELDAALRRMNPDDPVKYDFALFGLGVNEGWV